MKDKINVAELLIGCPSGMELDCTMYDNLYFDSLNADYYGTINCYTLIDGIKTSINFTKYGTFNNHAGAKCVIFPKGKTSWEGFQKPFEDGDIVTSKDRGSLIAFIYKERKNVAVVKYHFALYIGGVGTFTDGEICLAERELVFATEEEKAELFDAIKANGYKWNAETKTLEKLIQPKFKVGDRIKHKTHISQGDIVTEIKDTHYILNDESALPFTFQDEWELVPNKFDINTLVPFESKVLVRENKTDVWQPAFYGFFNQHNKRFYTTSSGTWLMCIPYNEDTKHLTGTTDDCDDFYRNL